MLLLKDESQSLQGYKSFFISAKIVGRLVFGGVAFVALTALVRDTVYQGQDFSVFWKAGRAILENESIYNLKRDGAMVFKYPPWIATLFVPMAVLPLEAAKWAWGIINVASLLSVIAWLYKKSAQGVALLVVSVAFWGIWAVHALDGQVMLPLLAAILWLLGLSHPIANAMIAVLSTTKIFTITTLGGRAGQFIKRSVIGWVAVIILVLSLPAIISTGGVKSLGNGWTSAASSGGQLFSNEKIRGRENQGFPALILRATKVSAENTGADVMAFLVCVLVLLPLLVWTTRSFGPSEKWSAWLAFAAVVHPLAWFHQFVWVFPLAVFSFSESFRKKSGFGLSVFGLVFVSCVTGKTMGNFGQALELLSIKSWGTVLCLLGLWYSKRKLKK